MFRISASSITVYEDTGAEGDCVIDIVRQRRVRPPLRLVI